MWGRPIAHSRGKVNRARAEAGGARQPCWGNIASSVIRL